MVYKAASAKDIRKAKEPILKVSIDLGKMFSQAKTNSELVSLLRAEAKKHKGYIKPLFLHLCSHLEHLDPKGSERPKFHILDACYGQDSCSGCGDDTCCLYETDGAYSCESC